jgi:hypothetical protein
MDIMDPYKKISPRQYRKYIERNFTINNNWNGYDVEHIIDKRSKFKGCKNIAGNYVMACKKWNRMLGTKPYSISLKIKKEIYGFSRIRSAYYYVRHS